MLEQMQVGNKDHWSRNVTPRGRPNHPPMSPAAIKFVKFSALIMLLCSVHCTAGSCSTYGHSCWGAHGKRSDNTVTDNVVASSLPEDLQNFILLARLFRGASTGAERHNTGAYERQSSIINERSMNGNGDQGRPWQDGAETWNEEGMERPSDGGGTGPDVMGNGTENENPLADINNSKQTDNYLQENGNNGNQYMTRHSLSPMDLMNLRRLLTKHLLKYN